jgi:hypothetical protein
MYKARRCGHSSRQTKRREEAVIQIDPSPEDQSRGEGGGEGRRVPNGKETLVISMGQGRKEKK